MPTRWLGLFAGRRRKPCGHGTDPLLPANIMVFTGGAVALALSHPDANWLSWAQAMLLFAVLVPLSVIDWQTMTVEPRLVAFGVGLRLLIVIIFQPDQFMASVGGMLIGAGFFHMLDFFYEMVRGRRGLGEGDAAVAGLVGAFVGWQGLVPVFALASIAGLIGGIAWLFISRRRLDAPIPFVPFVGVAGLAVYLAQLHGWIVAPSSSFIIR